MWLCGERVRDSDVSAVEFDTIQLFDAASSFFFISHGNEAESTGSLRALVIDNDCLFNMTISVELVFEIDISGSDR